MAEKQQPMGALWTKKDKQDNHYFSGVIEVDGKKIDVVIFKNRYKQEEKHPDWRVFKSLPREQRPVVQENDPF